MNRRVLHLALILAILSIGCRRAPKIAVSFSGAWKHGLENGITGAKTAETVQVNADPIRFRLFRQGPESETYEIFTGDRLITQFISLVPPSKNEFAPIETDSAAIGMEPQISSGPPAAQAMTDADAGAWRFWAQACRGKTRADIAIAGRPTRRCEFKTPRKDGYDATERWIDAQTGVVLKSAVGRFSTPTNAYLSWETYECDHIEYGSQDAALFEKP